MIKLASAVDGSSALLSLGERKKSAYCYKEEEAAVREVLKELLKEDGSMGGSFLVGS
jgi:hypothetical protein